MPWVPELFSAPVLERLQERAGRAPDAPVPYFEGLMTGEIDALIRSFAAEPEVHHPVRGRVKGERAFARFAADTNRWITDRDVEVEDVDQILTDGRGIEEFVLRYAADGGPVELPMAIVGDREPDGTMTEVRIYFSNWPLTGRHAIRPPLLQPDPDVREADVVGEYHRALRAGDADASVATFEPDGYVREPAGAAYVHRGQDELRALYELFFSKGGGIDLEHCTATDDGRACALEYNAVGWGAAELPPQAGVAVYVRGSGGRLAGARIYDDVDPPLA